MTDAGLIAELRRNADAHFQGIPLARRVTGEQLSKAAERLTQLSEENDRLERRLSGLHEANGKTVDTANEQFHRANRYGSALQWIAEHGDDEARQRARATLDQGQKEGA
ncbi:hypothetical protein [Paracoccus yeei]|uniref:hypothetical protein n=1 Tax=Paracoccus yeei TaxID=147645 RepID=UPI0028D7C45C|nr:hypothetical protein [Paracoccus yeei]